MEKFGVEASTGVQEDTQGLEGLPVVQMVPWGQMTDLLPVTSPVMCACDIVWVLI